MFQNGLIVVDLYSSGYRGLGSRFFSFLLDQFPYVSSWNLPQAHKYGRVSVNEILRVIADSREEPYVPDFLSRRVWGYAGDGSFMVNGAKAVIQYYIGKQMFKHYHS